MATFLNTENFSIKQLRDQCLTNPCWEYVRELQRDDRIGVQKLSKSVAKQLKYQEQNANHIRKLMDNQQNICQQLQVHNVTGVDEVGRGPVAGPVVACAVLFPDSLVEKPNFTKLDDSKKLSKRERLQVANELTEQVYYGIGVVDVKTIDQININNAVDWAMEKAIYQMAVDQEAILVDGDRVPKGLKECGQTVPGGDGHFACVSAASIIAKVYRDNIMEKLHEKFPQYNFYSNKGYGTAEHMAAIASYGKSPVHRKSFLH